jgi:hypothetical protein
LQYDYGISNVTVDGTALECIQGLNPLMDGMEMPFTHRLSPAEAAALDVAQTCPMYTHGAPAGLPVEMPDTLSIETLRDYCENDIVAEHLLRLLRN